MALLCVFAHSQAIGFPSARSRPGQRGSAITEAVLALALLFVLLFGLIDLCRVVYTAASLQFTLARAHRWGMLGATLSDPDSGLPLNREDSIELRINEEGRKFGFNLTDSNIALCPLSDMDCPALSDNAGASNQYVYIRLNWPLEIFGGLNVSLSAQTFARNEPYL